MMFENYEKFLAGFNSHIDSLFTEQSPYIFCKKGCSLCCSQGEYPMSKTEFDYLMQGYENLDAENKKIVSNRIKKLKKSHKKTKKQKAEHACPFLIANVCSVYSHRPLICRTFGLIKSAQTKDGQQVAILPDCIYHDLNYSNVFDPVKNVFDEEKIAHIDAAAEPMPYDISLHSIYENCPDPNIDFKIRKTMIEFLSESDCC